MYLIKYHLIIQRIIRCIFCISLSHSLFLRLWVDPPNCVSHHIWVVSCLLTLFLCSKSQKRSLSQIPVGKLWEVRRSVMMGSLSSSSVVSPQWSPHTVSGSKSWVQHGENDRFMLTGAMMERSNWRTSLTTSDWNAGCGKLSTLSSPTRMAPT